MKKFKFRLERLLNVKERLEKEKTKQVAVKRTLVREIEGRIEEVRKEIKAMSLRRDRISKGTVDMAEMMLLDRMITYCNVKREEETVRWEREKGILEELVSSLVEASREAEIVRKLKDSKKRQYSQDLRKEEQKERDENGIVVKGIRISKES